MPSDLHGSPGSSAASSSAHRSARAFVAQAGRWRLAILPILIGVAFLGWRFSPQGEVAEWKVAPADQAANASAAKPSKAPAWLGARGSSGADIEQPVGDMGDPAAQLALWNKRLARSQEVLDNYRKITRYPHDSRPAGEHGDQMYPNQPVVEEKRLYKPGDELKGNVRLRTSQERIFVAGRESVLFTITAFDGDGAVLPVNIISAGIIDPPQGGKASTRALLRASFNDGGVEGDAAAGDGTLSYRLTPALQGFADYTGQLRLDMTIEVAGQSGYTYFDIYYTPEPPAIWAGSVREVIENGSLNLYLKVQVRVPGRYVATGRLDDFTGKPFALTVFNEELAAGTQEIPLRAFGKLVLDNQPAFPLRLRDVDGFLLKEDSFPDRALMPRLPGLVHMTKTYPMSVFSDAEWQSEERDRYLREFIKDVDLAKKKIDDLGKLIGKGGK